MPAGMLQLLKRKGNDMEVYIGLDVSLASTAVCVLGEKGGIVTEARVASTPDALVSFMHKLPCGIVSIGLEAGPVSQWLHKGLAEAGFEVVLMETRQVKAALKAMPIKTDRRDAEGIARLLQLGWFRPVHCKTVSSQEMRALLTSRKSVKETLTAMELSLRGVLRNFGLKLGVVSKGRWEARVRELIAGNPMLEAAGEPILRARAALRRELAGLEKLVRKLGRHRPGVRPAHDHARRGSGRGPDFQVRDRRSRAVPEIEGCRSLGRPDAAPPSIGRTRYCRRDHQGRQRRSAHGALSGGHGDAARRSPELAEGLGAASGCASWQETSNRCPGAADRRGATPDVAGWRGVPLHARDGDGGAPGIGATVS